MVRGTLNWFCLDSGDKNPFYYGSFLLFCQLYSFRMTEKKDKDLFYLPGLRFKFKLLHQLIGFTTILLKIQVKGPF